MARSYRFFTKNLMEESFSTDPSIDFHFSESLEPEIFHQLMKVLRVKSGDEIILLPVQQSSPFIEYHFTVRDAQKKEIILLYKEKTVNKNELDFDLGLILCLPNKPDKLEFILQKAVELGTKKIVLVQGDTSQYKHGVRTERLEKIVMEAAEQSERALIPSVVIEGKLRNFLKDSSSHPSLQILVALERNETPRSLPSIIKEISHDEKQKGFYLVIGPEGGFSAEERALIAELKLSTYSLGSRILRMETAAIISLGLVTTPL